MIFYCCPILKKRAKKSQKPLKSKWRKLKWCHNCRKIIAPHLCKIVVLGKELVGRRLLPAARQKYLQFRENERIFEFARKWRKGSFVWTMVIYGLVLHQPGLQLPPKKAGSPLSTSSPMSGSTMVSMYSASLTCTHQFIRSESDSVTGRKLVPPCPPPPLCLAPPWSACTQPASPAHISS